MYKVNRYSYLIYGHKHGNTCIHNFWSVLFHFYNYSIMDHGHWQGTNIWIKYVLRMKTNEYFIFCQIAIGRKHRITVIYP